MLGLGSDMIIGYLERKVLGYVVMNDDVCLHYTTCGSGITYKVVILPTFIYRPSSHNSKHEFIVKCPQCGKEYPIATKLLENDFKKSFEEKGGKSEISKNQ